MTMTPDRVVTWTRPDGTVWKVADAADRAGDVLDHERSRWPRSADCVDAPDQLDLIGKGAR